MLIFSTVLTFLTSIVLADTAFAGEQMLGHVIRHVSVSITLTAVTITFALSVKAQLLGQVLRL